MAGISTFRVFMRTRRNIEPYSLQKPMNVRQGKSFQWCTNFLYCSVLSLGSNVNTRVGVSQHDMGSIFQIKNQ